MLKYFTNQRLLKILGLALFVASLALIFIAHRKPSLLFWSNSHFAYYFMLGLFAFWILSLIFFLKEHPWNLIVWSRENRNGLLLSLFLTILIFATVDPYFKILADETNLLSVSKSMVEKRTVDNVTMGKWFYFNYHPTTVEFEKRPLGFPFLLHIVHQLIGYHAWNAFVLNGLCLLGLFLLLYELGRIFLGVTGACALLLLTAAQPLLSITATSGGFDLASVFFALLCFLALRLFLRKQDFSSFLWLWTCLLVTSQIRYESPIFFLVVLSGLVWFRYIRRDYLLNPWLIPLSLFLMLPRIWQSMIWSTVSDIQFRPDEALPFNGQHFLDHNRLFFQGLFRFDYFLPYANLVILTGLLGLVVLFLSNRPASSPERRHLLIISGTCVVSLWIIVTSYSWGDLTHPASARFGVLFVLVLSFFAAWLLNLISLFRSRPSLMLSLCGLLLALYHPVSMENRFLNALILTREYRIELDFLRKMGHTQLLIIAPRPGQFTVHQYGAVDFNHANANKDQLLNELRRHLYRDIYVFQEIEYKTGEPIKDHQLDTLYRLKPELEIQNTAESFLRFSRVESGVKP